MRLLLLGVEVLLQRNTELFSQGLELAKILVVLGLVLDLGLDTYNSQSNVSASVLFFIGC